MELDEIKKVWDEMDLQKENPQIGDNKITEILKHQGKTALSKLIKTAKFYVYAMIPLGLIICLLSYKFFEAGGYYIICPMAFLLFCLLMEPLEIYLYRLLKGIDFSIMTVREVSGRMLIYHNIIKKSQLYGTMWFILYLGVWYFLYYKLIFGSTIIWGFIIYMIVLVITGVFVIQFLYKKLYFKNIKKIQESLEELKVFEN
jgi:hypothetical protein